MDIPIGLRERKQEIHLLLRNALFRKESEPEGIMKDKIIVVNWHGPKFTIKTQNIQPSMVARTLVNMGFANLIFLSPNAKTALETIIKVDPGMVNEKNSLVKNLIDNADINWKGHSATEISDAIFIYHLLKNGINGIFGDIELAHDFENELGEKAISVLDTIISHQKKFIIAILTKANGPNKEIVI